jgi:glycosyltransferase involved in cell wall biosynthesis
LYLAAVKKKLHVLFLSSWFPSKTHPTLGNFVQRHAEAVALFTNVTVLYLSKNYKSNAFEIEDEVEGNVRMVRVYYNSNGFLFRNRIRAFKKGIAHINFNQNKPDIVQLNMVWPEGWQALFIQQKWKIPFVISDNWTGYHPNERSPLPFHIKTYMRFVANRSKLLLPVTLQLEKAMRTLGFNKPSVIVPNAVNLNYFKNEKKNSLHTFLHLSHLDNNHKNIEGILQVWKKFADQVEDVFLELGGDGDIQHWKKRSLEIGLRPSSIGFFGTLNQKEVAEKMNAAHTFVLFSNYENLPLVMIEAMASGMNVIATHVGGIAEHMSFCKWNKLIDAKNEEQLLNALNASHKELHEVDRNEIVNYAIQNFSFDSVGKQFKHAYEKALTE